ncbi:hypothetical protein GF339_01335 [candidate division KSB3 bacterium]|uniref:Phosphohydrolase n=1 Tax=candidate division KSB3 bacterium TaxID=2044937 RepID=A0A9D5JSG8_9BACT|nr:hypothetical protein [candidate division KSB3 bacterium]MBD3323194.1 hypothetical protein [candidate division KSB3 bacterium]
MAIRCPGQDVRFWKPKDIFEIRCPYCGTTIEFWKDDPMRHCPDCDQMVSNPRIDLGCARWCKYAEECLGSMPEAMVADAPVIDRLTALLDKQLTGQAARRERAQAMRSLAETLMAVEGGDPCVVKASALLAGVLLPEQETPEASPLDDPQALLEEAGIATPLAQEISSVVEGVLGDQPPESLEGRVVWDTVQLQRLAMLRDADRLLPGSAEDILPTIRTRSGKLMARQYGG